MVQSVVELYSESSIGGSVCIGALLRKQLPRMLPLSRNESFGVDEDPISYRIHCVTRFAKSTLRMHCAPLMEDAWARKKPV